MPSQIVRFHAANILKKAIVREWNTITDQLRHNIISYILNYVTKWGYVYKTKIIKCLHPIETLNFVQ